MKRSASVKDSSGIVPGRGGILDSFDSLLFSAPVFVIIAAFMGFFPSLC
jgi:phosphatidate cytidylyltransferase